MTSRQTLGTRMVYRETFFVNPTASSSSQNPGGFNLWISYVTVMQRMQGENDRSKENLLSRHQVSLKSAVEDAVGRLLGELYHNLKNLEAKMGEKMQTHLNDHRSDVGVISLAEFCIRTEIQKTVDKNWKDRMENEDKIAHGKIESLHSMVNRLEHEVTTL